MHPIFIAIPLPSFLHGWLGPTFQIHTYGVMVALGFFLAISVVTREARHKGLDADQIVNLLFGNILWGVIGSRLLFVALEWESYIQRPLAILNIREGGLVFQGGLVCALLYSLLFIRRHELPLWKTVDTVVVGIPLGHMFGRLGCFAAGCCYGTSCDLPWAVTFTSELGAGAPLGVPIHPVQLYEAGGNLLLFVGLLLWGRSSRRRFDGQVGLVYFMAYPVLRILTELFRGDEVRGFFLSETLGQRVSTSQAISALELAAAVALYAWRARRVGSTGSAAEPSQTSGPP